MIFTLDEGAVGMSGDGMMSPDGKPKIDVKDDSGPTNEPRKPKVTPVTLFLSPSVFAISSCPPFFCFPFLILHP